MVKYAKRSFFSGNPFLQQNICINNFKAEARQHDEKRGVSLYLEKGVLRMRMW